MDLDFVGSPSSRRISQVLLEVLDELEIIIQHITSEPLNPSSPQTRATFNQTPCSVPGPRSQFPNISTICPHTAAIILLNLFRDARFDGS